MIRARPQRSKEPYRLLAEARTELNRVREQLAEIAGDLPVEASHLINQAAVEVRDATESLDEAARVFVRERTLRIKSD